MPAIRNRWAWLFLMLIFFLPAGFAEISDCPLREVVYDASNPELSVAVMGEELLGVGDLYQNTHATGFEPGAVILRSIETSDVVKCLKQENFAAEPKLHQLAVQTFIYKQMKAIWEAQIAYWNKFGQIYAPDLETLVRQGFLKGFEDGRKQNYFFEIAELGQTKDLAMFPKEVSFLAVAFPQEGSEGEWYFSVTQSGDVHYGATRVEAPWGPVWDYNEHRRGPAQVIVRKI